MYSGITIAEECSRDVVDPRYTEFRPETSRPRVAICAVILAHHQYDWQHQETFSTVRAMRVSGADTGLIEAFDMARKPADDTSHSRKRVGTRQRTGFSSALSAAFARPSTIVDGNGTETSVDALLETPMTCRPIDYGNS